MVVERLYGGRASLVVAFASYMGRKRSLLQNRPSAVYADITEVLKRLNPDDALPVYFTGFSWGGMLACYCSARTGRPAVAFAPVIWRANQIGANVQILGARDDMYFNNWLCRYARRKFVKGNDETPLHIFEESSGHSIVRMEQMVYDAYVLASTPSASTPSASTPSVNVHSGGAEEEEEEEGALELGLEMTGSDKAIADVVGLMVGKGEGAMEALVGDGASCTLMPYQRAVPAEGGAAAKKRRPVAAAIKRAPRKRSVAK
jgi:hypothetical protein